MDWTLPPLPYAQNALEPHLSVETLAYHYGKHHAGYLAELREEIDGTPLARCSLDELVAGADGRIFNLAAQVWNHTFYWRSLSPGGGGAPPRVVADALTRAFGSFDTFRSELIAAAIGEFASGWAWLYRDREEGRLVIASTPGALTPLAVGHVPLLAIDLWEHAYYLDYRHERERYAEAVIDHLVDWNFVRRNLDASAPPA
jgi:Fe-Mn family superoxide dismutase